MRSNSNIPKRILEISQREERQHEKTGRFVLCSIYTGKLGSGVESPGYIESMDQDRRPGAYVVPISVLEDRNIRGVIQQEIPADGLGAEARFADRHVRLVHIDNQGLSAEEIMKDYEVRVSYPFWTATHGTLVLKPGRRESMASVPDGFTTDDSSRYKLIDREISLLERMRMARGRYGTPDSPVEGVPLSQNSEQFPKPGDVWR